MPAPAHRAESGASAAAPPGRCAPGSAVPGMPSRSPATPPTAASTAPSVISCRSSRKRDAPSATRTAISRCRAAAPAQQQIRHVGARHQQHEPHRAEQQQHGHAVPAGRLLAQRLHAPGESAIRRWILLAQRRAQAAQSRRAPVPARRPGSAGRPLSGIAMLGPSRRVGCWTAASTSRSARRCRPPALRRSGTPPASRRSPCKTRHPASVPCPAHRRRRRTAAATKQ